MILLLLFTAVSAIVDDPEIDLININDVEELPVQCNQKECPRYKKGTEDDLPNTVGVRDYPDTYWVSTTRYLPVNNNCIEGTMMKQYYHELYNFYKGVNTMGLHIDRTLPIRLIGQTDGSGTIVYCYTLFYLPDIYTLNPPAPLSINVFVGDNWGKRCYSLAVRGPWTWKKAIRLQKALKKFLSKKDIPNIANSDLILDVYSGYGIPNSEKYAEVLVCDDNFKYG